MSGMIFKIEWETRLCEVNGELGYFHIWEPYSRVVDPNLLRGGHPGGQISQVYGIVEFKDRVERVCPHDIKFCDETNAILNDFNEMKKANEEKGVINEPVL